MKFTSVSEWLDWQQQLHNKEIDLGLERIKPVYSRLIQRPIANNIITIGGTNGKGSTLAFLEAIYVAAGYRVGSYTSPHLLNYNERIRLQGEPIDDESLCDAFEHVELARKETSLTYFEYGTLAAFHFFQHQSLDVVLLEVGLGGRLDVVNIVESDLSIITNVELDHMDWLGDTREKIAVEKFGITRQDKSVVFVDDKLPESGQIICAKNNISIYQLNKQFSFQRRDNNWHWRSPEKDYFSLPLPHLVGNHQLKNAAGTLMAIVLLENKLPVSMPHIRLGLTNVTLPGRFQVTNIGQDNLQISDVAHNPHGIKAFIESLITLPKIGDHLLVFGLLRDKSLDEVLNLLKPHIDHWFVTGIDDARGLSAEEIKNSMLSNGINERDIDCFSNTKQALESARLQLQKHDKLLVLGSFYVVSDALNLD